MVALELPEILSPRPLINAPRIVKHVHRKDTFARAGQATQASKLSNKAYATALVQEAVSALSSLLSDHLREMVEVYTNRSMLPEALDALRCIERLADTIVLSPEVARNWGMVASLLLSETFRSAAKFKRLESEPFRRVAFGAFQSGQRVVYTSQFETSVSVEFLDSSRSLFKQAETILKGLRVDPS